MTAIPADHQQDQYPIQTKEMAEPEFTPAAGRLLPVQAYDRLLALLTRERIWRGALLRLVAPRDSDRVLDVGSGTGSFAILLKQAAPGAVIVGLDPDVEARSIAIAKSAAAGIQIDWKAGFAREADSLGQFDKVVSSLVFHQVPLAEKRAGLEAMFAATKPGGSVIIADYTRQSSWLSRQAFRIVQMADGRANTQPNAEGYIERELERLGNSPVAAEKVFMTPTGEISLFIINVSNRPDGSL